MEKSVSKEFVFKLSLPTESVIEKARATAAKNGVIFTGDQYKGNFSGMGVVGEYRVVETSLNVHIRKKPMIMTWGMIEKSLNHFFAST
jgi:CYTH domain-containing protein